MTDIQEINNQSTLEENLLTSANTKLDNFQIIDEQKLYEDEVTLITDLLRQITKNRKENIWKNRKHVNNRLSDILGYMKDEIKQPFIASSAFREILSKQSFGPISPIYLKYYDDVRRADIELYYTLKKITGLLAIEEEIYNTNKTDIEIITILNSLIKRIDKNENLEIIINSKETECYLANSYLNSFILLFENILSLTSNNCQLENKYSFIISIQKQNRITYIEVKFACHKKNKKPLNDNFYEQEMGKIVSSLRNLEDPQLFRKNGLIDFTKFNTRSDFYSINFLAKLNRLDSTVLSSNNEFVIKFIAC